MADATVLFTCAGMRVDIVRTFRHALAEGPHHGRVLVADADPLAPTRMHADGVVDLPPVDDPGYGDAVVEACAREGARALLPLTDLDPVVLSERAGELAAAGTWVALPPPSTTRACRDKWECHLLLERAGLPSPPTVRAEDADPVAITGPVLVKPRIGFAGRDIVRCTDAAELAAVLERTPPGTHVVQESLEGATEFSVDCLGDREGRAVGAIPRSMLQARGGEQVKGETLDDPELVELGVRVVETLGLTGPATVQLFRDEEGIRGVTDINTRFGGGFPLPVAAGGGYPAAVVAMTAGEEPVRTVGRHRPGVVMTRHLDATLLVRTPAGLAPLGGEWVGSPRP